MHTYILKRPVMQYFICYMKARGAVVLFIIHSKFFIKEQQWRNKKGEDNRTGLITQDCAQQCGMKKSKCQKVNLISMHIRAVLTELMQP